MLSDKTIQLGSLHCCGKTTWLLCSLELESFGANNGGMKSAIPSHKGNLYKWWFEPPPPPKKPCPATRLTSLGGRSISVLSVGSP